MDLISVDNFEWGTLRDQEYKTKPTPNLNRIVPTLNTCKSKRSQTSAKASIFYHRIAHCQFIARTAFQASPLGKFSYHKRITN